METNFRLPFDRQYIPCTVNEPKHTAVERCVIGVHGLCGHKDNDIMGSIAEEICPYGTAMIRFDLPAHGDNPMTDRELTLENCCRSLMTVASYARERYPDVPMCLFATGFGAFVTVQVLEALTDMLGHVRLVLQTPDFRMADSLLKMKNISQEDLRKMGRVTVGRISDRKIEVPYSFYEQLREATVYADFEMPMLLLHGELDEVVRLEDVANFNRINEQAKMVIIPGADHQFRGAGQWDMVVDLVRDWFLMEDVILCDYE